MANAEKVLRDLLDKIAIEQGFNKYDVDIKPISTGGANYTSVLFLATISGDKDDLKVFAKVATISEKMRKSSSMKMFETERFFYTTLANVYRDIEKKHNVPEEHQVKFPIYYGNNPNYLEETIVLEDLGNKGYSLYDRTISMDWAYASTAVEQLAKLHALSFAYQKEQPEEFEETLKFLKFSLEIPGDHEKVFFDRCFKSAVEAAKDEHKEKIMHFMKTLDAKALQEQLAICEKPVLIHGDYRISNLMYKTKEDGSHIIKMMDFQTMQGSSPVVDLFYLIFTGTDEQFRKEYYQRLVDHYYEQLCAALKRLDINPDDVYSRKDYDHDLKEKLAYGLTVSIFVLPIVTVETKNAPVMDENADFTTFFIDKVGDIYPERMSGIISDYVRWGIL